MTSRKLLRNVEFDSLKREVSLHDRDMSLRFHHIPGSDLFYFQRNDFLVVADYFSKFLIMRTIHNSTSSAVIKE